MADLTDPRALFAKGGLFFLAGLLAGGLLLAFFPHWRMALLLSLCVWCFCRAYYFAFYVIEHYVDDNYRFAGLWDFARYACAQRFGWKPPQE